MYTKIRERYNVSRSYDLCTCLPLNSMVKDWKIDMPKQLPSLAKEASGYLRVEPLPDDAELQKYYSNKYFASDSNNNYEDSYTKTELEHKAIIGGEFLYLLELHKASGQRRFLDVGCGEGFTLKSFDAAGWSVQGIDLTLDGLMRTNSELVGNVVKMAAEQFIEQCRQTGIKFDAINCTNVVEHVRDPTVLMRGLADLITDEGLLRVQVPNDGSWLQKRVIDTGQADDYFYVTFPDHLSYFTIDGVSDFGTRTGWTVVEKLSDFPIDIFLLNRHSNYIKNSVIGNEANKCRITMETEMASIGFYELAAFRRGCATAGIGRNSIVYFRKQRD